MGKALAGIILVYLILSALSNLAVAQHACGVKNGDWMRYDMNVTSGGQGGSGSIKINIQNVQGTQVSGTIEISVQGFTITEPENFTIDIAAGAGTYAGFIIPANLTVGDSIPGEYVQVENVVTKNGREAIQANASSPIFGFSGVVYWDQATGVLLETSGSAVGATYSMSLAETSLWSGGFPLFLVAVIIIIVVAAVAVIGVVTLRKRKPPVPPPQLQAPPPPPPPPPPR